MKKAIHFLLIILSFISCHSDKRNYSANNDTIVQEDIVFYIPESQIDLKQDSVIEATITNNTSNKIVTDLKYTIEYFEYDNWVVCMFPDNIIFNDVALNIHPSSSASVDIYLYPEYIHYKPGLYRIKKMILVENIKKYYYQSFNITD